MKKTLLAAFAAVGISVVMHSCQPDDPGVYNLNFDGTTYIDGCEMTRCTPPGTNCKKVGDHNVLDLHDARTALNTFYRYAKTGRVKNYFENENWRSLFTDNDITPAVKAQIEAADYKVRITRDSAVLFIRDAAMPSDTRNVIFALYRDDAQAKNAPCNL